jgi:NADPH:quinone reductase
LIVSQNHQEFLKISFILKPSRKTVKAIRVSQFGGPEVLKWEEIPDLIPAPTQVLVGIKAAGVNPIENYVRTGTYALKPNLPYTPGADGAGIVQAVGASVTRFKTGDSVYLIGSQTGTYAEQALALENQVFPLPKNITFAQGAALGIPYSTAHRALFHRAQAQKGESVLIHGASGGVGTAAIQLAKRAGLTVIGTGGTDQGRQLIKTLGADFVLDHHDPNFSQKLLEVTENKGVNIIIEMLANINLGRDLTYLSKYGRVVVVGSRGPVEINPRDLMSREAAILGMVNATTNASELEKIHFDLIEGLKDGSIKPIVGQELPLKDAAQSHEAVMKPGAHGKIVLIP